MDREEVGRMERAKVGRIERVEVGRMDREEVKLEMEAFASPGAGRVAETNEQNARRSEISAMSPVFNSMGRRT